MLQISYTQLLEVPTAGICVGLSVITVNAAAQHEVITQKVMQLHR